MTLDLTAKGFSLANAKELALCARRAYDEPPTVQDKGTDTQVLIKDVGDCIIVSFRGTSNLRDFITDAKAWRTHTLLGGIHAGFYEAFRSIQERLVANLNLISAHIQGRRPILIDGHSLGGGLGIIAAKILRDLFFNVHSVYTFGCPRPGDKLFRDNYNATLMPGSPFDNLGEATFTVIHDCDIVPRVPGWLSGYRRPGHDEFISALDDSQIVEDPSLLYRLESDAWSLFNAWRARRNPTFLDELLTDHHINKYITALEAVRGEDAGQSDQEAAL